jgi:tetratricopeptide (TPR) repeat protein
MSTELKAACLYSVPITLYSALSFSLSLPLNISAGRLFEMMVPVSFALTVLLSAWVLASARRYRFRAAAVTLWTLGTLFFPFVIMPLYLIARSYRRGRERERAEDETERDSENPAGFEEAQRPWPLRRTLPLAYLALMLSLGALYFYMDGRSVDAHLARANQARLQGPTERVIAEYRAALKLEDNAHTHNLLGKELLTANRLDEALAELRTAERMGEADEELPFNIATALDKSNRTDEAKAEYERFVEGAFCAEPPDAGLCWIARRRLSELKGDKPR